MRETSIWCTWVLSPRHKYLDHPESPERLRGLEHWRQETDLPLHWVEAEPATEEAVLLAHHPLMWERLQHECATGPQVIDYAPTYVTPYSCEDALRAVGGLLALVDAVVQGKTRRAFALIRPPGHHATRTQSMGFCLVNNVAIAARYALRQGIQRVAIVDFDAHHGNGTQAIFEQDEAVAFLSLHQWGIYPGTGDIDDVPAARGRIVNIPFPALTGGKGYRYAFETIVAPWLERVQPELVLVSAGFDAHWQDPLTQLGLTAADFADMAAILVQTAESAAARGTVFVLEGGYAPSAVARSVRAVLHRLAGRDLPEDAAHDQCPYAEPDVSDLLRRVRAYHGL